MPRLMLRDGARSLVRDVEAPVPLELVCGSTPEGYGEGWTLRPEGDSVALVSPRGEKQGTLPPGGTLALGRVTLALPTRAGTERVEPERRGRAVLCLPDGRRIPLGTKTLTLGSAPSCDVVITDPTVSARHCTIALRRDGWEVQDAHSTNGTRVSGVRIERAYLSAGMVLALGRARVLCAADTDASGPSPEPRAGESMASVLVGESPAMVSLRAAIERYAPQRYPVLVQGETGAGKEIVARLLHARSPRERGPFVALNAGAIPPELVESELFGHERGAFTGATGKRRGVFEEAHGGTLFLDEIGELPLAQQAKLLRVLETREVRRVGAEGAVPVDFRLVCATHRNLAQHVESGAFRRDLLYRLDLLRVQIPPLRERRGDIPLLAHHLLARIGVESGLHKTLGDGALARLIAHDWPGNVRELYGVLCRAAACDDGPRIEPEHLVFPDAPRATPPEARTTAVRPDSTVLARRTADPIDAERLRALHAACGGNLSRLARATGLARSTLRERLKKAGG